MNEKIARVMSALENNNMAVFYAEHKTDIIEIVKGIVEKGETVSCGGAESLKECGVRDFLKSGYYNFLDRTRDGITLEEINEIYAKTFTADAFFTSANAVTEEGILYNVDGNSNRVAAICYGPKKVICVVGVNKIVPDMPSAVRRVKEIAAPLNVKRLGLDTPCARLGHCCMLDGGIGSGCNSLDRICISFTATGYQRKKNRINVIICEEPLGY